MDATFSLTPALSRWEREKLRPPLDSAGPPDLPSAESTTPLSQRERAGVRENAPQHMNTHAITPGRFERGVTRFSHYLSTGSFAVFILALLVFYQIFVAVMSFAPPSPGRLGELIEQFRIRCFNFDPRTGSMSLAFAWAMLLEPLPIGAIVAFLWRHQLREIWRSQRQALVAPALTALLLVLSIAASLAGFRGGQPVTATTELPFPADRLRSALPMPDFKLTNQDGLPVALADFKGRVTLVTAVFSTCTTACPMMLKKIREVLDGLTPAERAELSVVAFSLNPEVDTRELRTMITKAYGFDAAQFHFVNGVPAEMNRLLDELGFSRQRNEQTGEINHANLFFLLDREGRIAYRLSLSQREQSWLLAATRALVGEQPR
jgi:protein SCO1/2